jgi:hypothetical protein
MRLARDLQETLLILFCPEVRHPGHVGRMWVAKAYRHTRKLLRKKPYLLHRPYAEPGYSFCLANSPQLQRTSSLEYAAMRL